MAVSSKSSCPLSPSPPSSLTIHVYPSVFEIDLFSTLLSKWIHGRRELMSSIQNTWIVRDESMRELILCGVLA